jgi:hypothetical protein
MHVNAPSIAAAARAQCDPDMLDTWDFDVFFYTPEQLVAYVALMFMHLGLTTQDVRADVASLILE